MSGIPSEIQTLIEQVLADWKIKQNRIRLPLMVTLTEAKEILIFLETLRKT